MLFPDNIAIISGVGRSRNEGIKLIEKLRSTDLLQKAAIFQSLLKRNEIDRFTLVAEFDHQLIHDLVSGRIESFGVQPKNAKIAHLSGREYQRAENPFFGVFTVRERSRNFLARGVKNL